MQRYDDTGWPDCLQTLLPILEDALKRGEERLTEKLGETTNISLRTYLNEKLIEQITELDHEKFRSELWYSSAELLENSNKTDFICLIVYLKGEPVAFLYGYDDESDPRGFFLDEVATHIEGKGIGKVLLTLLLIYTYELDYTHVTLYTEDLDDKGRRLREFYEHIGFSYLGTEPEKGVIMRYKINEESLQKLYQRVMYSEGGPHPPYLSS